MTLVCGPCDLVQIDHDVYPHIIDWLFKHARAPALIALRQACKSWHLRADRLLVEHVLVYHTPQGPSHPLPPAIVDGTGSLSDGGDTFRLPFMVDGGDPAVLASLTPFVRVIDIGFHLHTGSLPDWLRSVQPMDTIRDFSHLCSHSMRYCPPPLGKCQVLVTLYPKGGTYNHGYRYVKAARHVIHLRPLGLDELGIRLYDGSQELVVVFASPDVRPHHILPALVLEQFRNLVSSLTQELMENEPNDNLGFEMIKGVTFLNVDCGGQPLAQDKLHSMFLQGVQDTLEGTPYNLSEAWVQQLLAGVEFYSLVEYCELVGEKRFQLEMGK